MSRHRPAEMVETGNSSPMAAGADWQSKALDQFSRHCQLTEVSLPRGNHQGKERSCSPHTVDVPDNLNAR